MTACNVHSCWTHRRLELGRREANLANPQENDFAHCLVSFSFLPEDEHLTETQCKGITKASILHNVNDLAPAEAALPLDKPA